MDLEIRFGEAIADTSGDVLVVPMFEGGAWGPGGDWITERLPSLEGFLETSGFTGASGTKTVPAGDDMPFTAVMVLGLGEEVSSESLRKAAGRAARASKEFESAVTTLHLVDIDGAAEAVAFGALAGMYKFEAFKSESKPTNLESFVLAGDGGGGQAALDRGVALARGVFLARDLVNYPAHAKPPEMLAARAGEVAAEHGLDIKIYDEQEIVAERFGGLVAVSSGAANPPRMVVLDYTPEGATKQLTLVGKGIVFDSGGLSIKPASGMEDMKTDMAGAATVMGAIQAIADLGIDVRVRAIMPFTENVISGNAMRPGDVFTARNGKTVEVLNTDAEGRLILADGLSLAAESDNDLVIDVATLTGAAKVALGLDMAAVFGTDDAREMVRDAGEAAGEMLWPMPLHDAYRSALDSNVADLKNIGDRWGGAITAALFLREFAGDGEWAHLDIAGPARAPKSTAYTPKGASGFGVRTLVVVAESLAAS
ncbi:MAG: leucyl aminopeptidase [Acidimicrobiia bacterium]|nr:leucyl aminopeptidase [Acidimicrobiia bacterium]